MSAFTTVTVKISKTKTKKWEKIGEKLNLSAAEAEVKFRNIRTACGRYLKRLKTLPSGSGRDAVPREFQNRLTKERNQFVCCKISSLTSAILFAAIFLPAQRACNFDTVRNVSNSRLCDRLRLAIHDRPRSSAIIWKPALRAITALEFWRKRKLLRNVGGCIENIYQLTYEHIIPHRRDINNLSCDEFFSEALISQLLTM